VEDTDGLGVMLGVPLSELPVEGVCEGVTGSSVGVLVGVGVGEGVGDSITWVLVPLGVAEGGAPEENVLVGVGEREWVAVGVSVGEGVGLGVGDAPPR